MPPAVRAGQTFAGSYRHFPPRPVQARRFEKRAILHVYYKKKITLLQPFRIMNAEGAVRGKTYTLLSARRACGNGLRRGGKFRAGIQLCRAEFRSARFLFAKFAERRKILPNRGGGALVNAVGVKFR